MKSICFLLSTALLLAAGCKTQKEDISRLWFYTHSTRTSLSNAPALTPASFLLLRPDGSFTRDFGKYESGNWGIKGDTLRLTNRNGGQHLLPFKSDGINSMQLQMGNDETAHFEAITASSATSPLHPFDEALNQWRIPPVRKKTVRKLSTGY